MTLTAYRPQSIARHSQSILAWSAMILIAGCGGPDPLGRHAVSGTITFRGQPVPKGFVKFIPDTSKGNKGPGGGAPIENGKLHAPANKGVVGGPYLIEIDGSDGIPAKGDEGEMMPNGKALFPTVQLEHDFPIEDSVWDYDVSKGFESPPKTN